MVKPTQPVELVVHGGPGCGNDVMARQLTTIIEQEKLVAGAHAGRPTSRGGGSTTAAAYMASKKGDPNTIAVFTSVWVTDPLTQEAATNRLNDLTPIARLIDRAGADRGAGRLALQDAEGLRRRGEGASPASSSSPAARSPRATTSCAS